MKANGKFFKFSFIFNIVLGAIGFLILWLICSVTDKALVGMSVCSVVLLAIALYVNIFIVKKSKLKIMYFIFGTVVNIITVVLPTVFVIF